MRELKVWTILGLLTVAAMFAGCQSDPQTTAEGTHGNAPAAGHGTAVHWSYAGDTGPAFWGDLNVKWAECKTGLAQSPIDLTAATPAPLDAIEFAYTSGEFEVVNNGHTIQVNVANGSTATIRGKHYTLKQFHFHLPSEHAIDGQRAAMEVHFVHADAAGHLAVVGAMLNAGGENAAMDAILAATAKQAAHGAEETAEPATVTVDPNALLPAGRRYFHYAGSLTTPPCSENVNWNVMVEPVSISTNAVNAFRKIFPMNARPLQPLNGRNIEVSE